MGRATAPTPAYRDDPDAVSLNTTPDDYVYSVDNANLPPSYADSEASSAPAFTAPIHHLPPPTTRTNHASPSFKHGHPVVCSTLNLIDPLLDNDPVLLEKTIRANARIPPVQYIYIMGTHKETVRRGDRKETSDITDFRIVLNLSPYLHPNFDPSDTSTMGLATVENSEKVYRGSMLQQRAPRSTQDMEGAHAHAPTPTLTEWAHRYCASSSRLRSFRLQRVVTGLDTVFLQQRIEGLIRSTNYRGHIAITFPVEDAHLDIYTDTFVNRWRLKPWVRWIFYLSFLWLVTWPALFVATKRFAVVRAQWPFSYTPLDGSPKLYTTVSEAQWIERWHVALRRLVLDRWQGEASDDVMRGVAARPHDPAMPGVLPMGFEGVDTAVGLLNHGLHLARAVRNGGLETGLQGGWGYDC